MFPAFCLHVTIFADNFIFDIRDIRAIPIGILALDMDPRFLPIQAAFRRKAEEQSAMVPSLDLPLGYPTPTPWEIPEEAGNSWMGVNH